ncbi:RHS repeat-associated core domain-containing protein [Chromobacterium piscinae]|uniref:RHS repeat-associated core domain-containing protein n=1 Tax=Chromobacterium piscinae TaxID=686831 RepID=UPI003207973E
MRKLIKRWLVLGMLLSGGLLPSANIVAASAPTIYYVQNDQLGTPREVVDSDNVEVWRWEGDAYGNEPPNQDPSNTGKTFVFNLRYPGQYYDTETGRIYNGWRDYDPAVGRYVQSDPIGLLGGQWSTYAYVGGNPGVMVDPDGLMAMPLPILPLPGLPQSDALPRNPGNQQALPLPPNPGRQMNRDVNRQGHISHNSNSQCPKPPKVNWDDPSKPPVGDDGKPWPWRGPDAPGGARGGYVNPNNPGQSVHPDLDHPEPIGPHWDFTDRGNGQWRIFPNGNVTPK